MGPAPAGATLEADAQAQPDGTPNRSTHRRSRSATRRRYATWAAIVVVALVPFVIIGGPGAGWLRDLGLLGREERFTELALAAPDRLPSSVPVGAPLSFGISLANHEGGAETYRWRAVVATTTEAGVTERHELARGRVRLGDGEARRIRVGGPAPGPAGAAVVTVGLVGRREAVDFRITVVTGPATFG